MTLAAMLLVSIGAFAQSGSTLKGDVNGDGKVDVEDVTSLVDLILSGKTYGYFYFGTTQPTAVNYQTLSGLVTSYTSIGDAIGATASIVAGETLYMLCPAAWMKGKKVVVEDGAGGSYNFIEDIDAETVPGYVIYKKQAWEEATDLTLNFEITGGDEYFWYLSETKPTSDTDIESNGYESTESISTLNISDSNNYQYFAWPKEWGIQTLIDNANNGEFTISNVASLQSAFDNNSNSNYYCKRISKNTGDITCRITWN